MGCISPDHLWVSAACRTVILRVMGSKENLQTSLRKLFPQQLQWRKMGIAGFSRGTGATAALKPCVPFVSPLYHPAGGSCSQQGLTPSMGRTDTLHVTTRIPKATVPRESGHKGHHISIILGGHFIPELQLQNLSIASASPRAVTSQVWQLQSTRSHCQKRFTHSEHKFPCVRLR